MRTLTTIAMLAAMAAVALAQDPNQNRMNDQYPKAVQKEQVERPFGQVLLPAASENRMNVRYLAGGSAEVTGGPNPYGNRMNFEWPKTQPKAQPKEVERTSINPTPSP